MWLTVRLEDQPPAKRREIKVFSLIYWARQKVSTFPSIWYPRTKYFTLCVISQRQKHYNSSYSEQTANFVVRKRTEAMGLLAALFALRGSKAYGECENSSREKYPMRQLIPVACTGTPRRSYSTDENSIPFRASRF